MPDASVLRGFSELATVSLASRGVRSSVIRLPPSVHGDGDRGFVPRMIDIARETGVSAFIGDGANRWSAVHRLDAARLYRLALESGEAGARYHAVGEEGIPVRELAEVIGRRLNLPTRSKPAEEASDHFGFLATFLSRDAPASAAFTRDRLGWAPSQRGLIADLEDGCYFDGGSSKFSGR
jgi:nucleoside-diphosphate-sugar epimerase